MIWPKYSVNYWRPMLAAAAPDLPIEKLCAWVALESNGNPAGLGTIWEVGIFQIDFQDAKTGTLYGATVQGLHGAFTSSRSAQVRNRDLTPDEESLQVSSGIAYARYCLTRAQAVSSGWSAADQWCLAKMMHALPAMLSNGWTAAATAGATGSWSDFRGYWIGPGMKSPPSNLAHYAPEFPKIFLHCTQVGYAGEDAIGALPGVARLDVTTGVALAACAAALLYLVR